MWRYDPIDGRINASLCVFCQQPVVMLSTDATRYDAQDVFIAQTHKTLRINELPFCQHDCGVNVVVEL